MDAPGSELSKKRERHEKGDAWTARTDVIHERGKGSRFELTDGEYLPPAPPPKPLPAPFLSSRRGIYDKVAQKYVMNVSLQLGCDGYKYNK